MRDDSVVFGLALLRDQASQLIEESEVFVLYFGHHFLVTHGRNISFARSNSEKRRRR